MQAVCAPRGHEAAATRARRAQKIQLQEKHSSALVESTEEVLKDLFR